MDRIYLDHSATTPVDARVLDAMLPHLRDGYGNASSAHALGRRARVAVEESRERVAAHLGAEPSEIIFTSGGTEADNMALRGMLQDSGRGLVTSPLEHAAILRCTERLAEIGNPVTMLTPQASGAVGPQEVERAITAETGLVSLMYVNNELGTVMPLRAISKVCRAHGVPFHTDAIQAASLLPLNVQALGVDLMSLSGHKMYGPKGVGVLFVRAGLDVRPLLLGGAQERDRRGGTENVSAIVGMACALDLAMASRERNAAHITRLRRCLEQGIRTCLGADVVFNTPTGDDAEVAPHILNVSFTSAGGHPLDGEMLLLNLDVQGIMVSAGSACASGALEPSHVLLGLGRDRETASATLRFSLGKDTTAAEIDATVTRLADILARMREHRVVPSQSRPISPVWNAH